MLFSFRCVYAVSTASEFAWFRSLAFKMECTAILPDGPARNGILFVKVGWSVEVVMGRSGTQVAPEGWRV